MRQSAQFDFVTWRAKFLKQVDRVAFARDSWRQLTASCDPEPLMWGLAYACDFKGAPGYALLTEIRHDAKQRAARESRIAKRLEIDLKEVRELLGDIHPEWQETCRTVIARLKEDVATTRRETSARYLKPSLFLMLVVAYVEAKNEAPHYRDISTVLNIAYETFGAQPRTGVIGEEALRKTVDRFKARNPNIVLPDGNFDWQKISRGLGFFAIIFLILHFITSKVTKLPPDASTCPRPI